MILNRQLGISGLWVCPSPGHKTSTTKKRFIICVQCGEKRYLKGLKSGGATTRCKACQKIHNNHNMVKWQDANSYPRRRFEKKADLNRRANCEHNPECLMKYRFYNDLPCKNCQRFKKQDFNQDVYSTRYDYSERSRHGGIVFV